jgi:hypothetical protein
VGRRGGGGWELSCSLSPVFFSVASSLFSMHARCFKCKSSPTQLRYQMRHAEAPSIPEHRMVIPVTSKKLP